VYFKKSTASRVIPQVLYVATAYLDNLVFLLSFAGTQTWIISVDEKEYTLRRAWELYLIFAWSKTIWFKSFHWPWTKIHATFFLIKDTGLAVDENSYAPNPALWGVLTNYAALLRIEVGPPGFEALSLADSPTACAQSVAVMALVCNCSADDSAATSRVSYDVCAKYQSRKLCYRKFWGNFAGRIFQTRKQFSNTNRVKVWSDTYISLKEGNTQQTRAEWGKIDETWR
jgi:hypothetical protein